MKIENIIVKHGVKPRFISLEILLLAVAASLLITLDR